MVIMTGLEECPLDGSIAVFAFVVVDDILPESLPLMDEVGATGDGEDDRAGAGADAGSSPR